MPFSSSTFAHRSSRTRSCSPDADSGDIRLFTSKWSTADELKRKRTYRYNRNSQGVKCAMTVVCWTERDRPKFGLISNYKSIFRVKHWEAEEFSAKGRFHSPKFPPLSSVTFGEWSDWLIKYRGQNCTALIGRKFRTKDCRTKSNSSDDPHLTAAGPFPVKLGTVRFRRTCKRFECTSAIRTFFCN